MNIDEEKPVLAGDDVDPLKSEDIIDTPHEFRRFSQARLIQIRQELVDRVEKKADINWINYFVGTLIWHKLKKHIKLDLVTLYFILAHFDVLKPFMPNETAVQVIQLIDKIGEALYKKKEEENKQ